MLRRRSGFTLVEALVAATITAVGVGASIAAIGALEKRQAKVNDSEVMLRLAKEKFDEIVAIQDFTTPSGDFTDRNDSSHLWSMNLTQMTLPTTTTTATTTPTSTSTSGGSTQNQGQLEMMTVTVRPSSSTAPTDSETVSGAVWENQQVLNGTTASP